MTIDPLVVRVVGEQAAVPDPEVVLRVHSRRGQELFSFARRLGLSDEQAADAVQDALLRMWREVQRGTVIEQPDAWAFRTVYRLAMDAHRWQRRIERLRASLGARAWRMDSPADPTDRLAVWAEVDHLPLRQRHVLYLRFRADLSFEDVGSALGITSSAARSHCAAALATLRRRFDNSDEADS